MWDLMDGGEYTYNGGYCPTPYSPWEMDVMGWATPIELSDEKQTVTLKSYGKERVAYKIKGENNEYLLLQNIQIGGWWTGVALVYKKVCWFGELTITTKMSTSLITPIILKASQKL